MNIKFEKDGVIKETHEKCTDALIAVGWKVVEDEKPKKRGRKPKHDNS